VSSSLCIVSTTMPISGYADLADLARLSPLPSGMVTSTTSTSAPPSATSACPPATDDAWALTARSGSESISRAIPSRTRCGHPR